MLTDRKKAKVLHLLCKRMCSVYQI